MTVLLVDGFAWSGPMITSGEPYEKLRYTGFVERTESKQIYEPGPHDGSPGNPPGSRAVSPMFRFSGA